LTAAKCTPNLAAQRKEVDKLLGKLHADYDELAAMPPFSEAAARDAALLTEAAQAASSEEVRSKLLDAANAALQQEYLAPQVVLLSSNPTAKWGCHCTKELAADGDFSSYLNLLKRRFQVALMNMRAGAKLAAAQHERGTLPSLEHVELRLEPAGGVGAASSLQQPKARGRPRNVLAPLWGLFQPLLKSLGRASWF
jgi:hypothetical protein